MPLQPIRKTFPFAFGIKDSEDKHKFFISQLTEAKNVGFIEKNAIEMTRAFGFVGSLQNQGIIAIQRVGRQVLAFSPQKIYKVGEDYGLTLIGSYLNADITNATTYQSYTDSLYPDLIIQGNEAHLTFQQENQIFHLIYDIEESDITQRKKQISTPSIGGIKPRIALVLGNPYILFLSPDKNNLYLYNEMTQNTELILTTQEILNFDVRPVSGILNIDYQIATGHHTFQFSVSRNSVVDGSDMVNPNTTNYRNFKALNTIGGITLHRMNKWTEFTFNDETYTVFWNNFRGYFVTDSAGNLVGKFLGKVSPPINKDGVQFSGHPQITDGTDTFTVFLPALRQSLQVQQDRDTITNPLGVDIIKIEVNKKRFISTTVGTKVLTAISGAMLGQIDSSMVSEVGFSEAPEIASNFNNSDKGKILGVDDISATASTAGSNVVSVAIPSSDIGIDGLKVPKQISGLVNLTTLKKVGGSSVPVFSSTRGITTTYQFRGSALNEDNYFVLEELNGAWRVRGFNRSNHSVAVNINLGSSVSYHSISVTATHIYLTGLQGTQYKLFKKSLPSGSAVSETNLSARSIVATDGDFLWTMPSAVVAGTNTITKRSLDLSAVGSGNVTFTGGTARTAGSLAKLGTRFYFNGIIPGSNQAQNFGPVTFNETSHTLIYVNPSNTDFIREIWIRRTSGSNSSLYLNRANLPSNVSFSDIDKIVFYNSQNVQVSEHSLINGRNEDNREREGIDSYNAYRFQFGIVNIPAATANTYRFNLKLSNGNLVFSSPGVNFENVFLISGGTVTQQTFLNTGNTRPAGIGVFERRLGILDAPDPAGSETNGNIYFYNLPSQPTLRIGISSRTNTPPGRTDFSRLILMKGDATLFNQVVSGSAPPSSTDDNERFYDIPLSDDLESAGYSLQVTFTDQLPNRWTTGALNSPFSLGDQNFTINKIQAVESGDKIHLNITFASVPEGSIGFHIRLSEIQSASPSDFVYSSRVGNVLTFVSEEIKGDVGFVAGTDEVFDLEVRTGASPGAITIDENDQVVTYFAVYKWTDSNGKVYYSKISNLKVVTIENAKVGEGNNPAAVPVEISYLNLTNKDDVVVQLYRSTFVSQSLSASNFQKVGEIANVKSGDKVTFIDTKQVKDLKERFFLFGYDQPNSGSIMIEHEKRFVIANGENIYFSEKPIFEREEGIAFKIDAVQQMSSPVQALASLDEKIIAITENGIFALIISPTGIVQEKKIQSLQNTRIVKNSIQAFQHGVVFQTNYGIALLDRGLTLQYIGDDIKKHLGEGEIVDTFLDDSRQEIYLRMKGSNINLVWNYLYNQWTTLEGNVISSIGKIDGERLRLDGNGRLLSSKNGAKTSLTSVVETGDIDLTGAIQGFNRLVALHFLGEFKDFERILIEIAKDGLDAFEAEVEINPSDIEKSLAQVGINFGDQNVDFGGESSLSRHFEVPMRLGRMSTFRVRWTITSRNPSKLSAVGVYGMTDRGRFFREGIKFPATG